MSITKPPLRAVRVENFKAIRDSGNQKLGWITAFIGNNGVGKSSLIEALETFQDSAINGIDEAFARWRGFEKVWNRAHVRRFMTREGDLRSSMSQPMVFRCDWGLHGNQYGFMQRINTGDPAKNEVFIEEETIVQTRNNRKELWKRDSAGRVYLNAERYQPPESFLGKVRDLGDSTSILGQFKWECFERWQFLMLNPQNMGYPRLEQRSSEDVRLNKDGSNIAQYLHDILRLNSEAFNGIVDALRFVLPFTADLQPTLTSEVERSFYLKMKESTFDVPGWLLSTGTLRVVAILACLRHPNPPPLLVIEEIENGLDPRTLNLFVEEFRAAAEARTTQIIFTTHSPYLLDLLDLSHIIVVERENGEPKFNRPDVDGLKEWAKSFSPGRLYTMGRLTKDGHQ